LKSYVDANVNTLTIDTTSASTYANLAFAKANTGNILAQAAFDSANNNTAIADQKAVSAGSYANGAFATANTKLNASGGTITGDLAVSGNTTISGSLIVSGNVTYINTSELNVGDNIINLNSDVLTSTSPTENAGITVNRGSATSTSLLWNETIDRWTFTNDGTNYSNVASSAAEVVANSALNNAATADQRAVTSGSFANSAYLQANTALNNAATADQKAVSAGVYANAAFGIANTASSTATSAGAFANTGISNAASASSYANSAFGRANTASTHATSGYNQANTATTNAATAQTHAAAAFGVANSASAFATSAGTFTSTSQNSQFNSIGVGIAPSNVPGEILAFDNITAYASSDRRLKENIVNISNAIQKVQKLNGVEYDWIDAYIEERGGQDDYFVRKHDIGLIAQEVEEVLPEIVATRANGYKAIKYERVVALLVEAIKELSDKIDKLEKSEK
jgi:hypothetical protein